MREKIAQTFETARDAYATDTVVVASKSYTADGTPKVSTASVAKSGYTAIGIIMTKPGTAGIGIDYAHITSGTLTIAASSRTGAAVSSDITVTILYKNTNCV